jgi:putative DNA primase/helicase
MQDTAAGGYLDWMPSKRGDNDATATYEYTDEAGGLLFGVCRNASKEFRQWRPDASKSTGRRWSLKDDAGALAVRLVLYRLPRVLKAIAAGETVFVCEGEKDVHALEDAGVTATCNPMGAGKWDSSYAGVLRGASVVIVCDKDAAGWNHMRTVTATLDGTAASWRAVCAAEGKDAADHLDAGHGLDDFTPLDLASPPEWAVPDEAATGSGEGGGASGEVWPHPAAPMAVARQFAAGYAHPSGFPVLRHWRGGWTWWNGTRYVPVEDGHMAKLLYERLEHAFYEDKDKLVPWTPNRRRIGDVLDALKAILLLPETVTPPCWLDGHAAGPVIPLANGLLDPGTRKLNPHSPAYFALDAASFGYDPDAPAPAAWLKFLAELWPDDTESVRALRQQFGYQASGRTDLQKGLIIEGPTRGGKGTIGRVMIDLAGPGNVAGPKLATLGGDFGLEPLLNAGLAVISDVRLGPKADLATIVEHLLTVIGEDLITVNRKYQKALRGVRLPVRFVLLTNELPGFADASGALAGRFVVLTLTRSWLGCEDETLYGRLAAELPGILNWALDGLDDLNKTGRLIEPAASRDAVQILADATSNHKAFARERCLTGPGYESPLEPVYGAWKAWCLTNGHDYPGSIQTFARKLRAAVPGLTSGRPRDANNPSDDAAPRPTVYYGIALRQDSVPGSPYGTRYPPPGTQYGTRYAPSSALPLPGEMPSGTQRDETGRDIPTHAYAPAPAPAHTRAPAHNLENTRPARPAVSPAENPAPRPPHDYGVIHQDSQCGECAAYRAERRAWVAKLDSAGVSVKDIAVWLAVSTTVVRDDLKRGTGS